MESLAELAAWLANQPAFHTGIRVQSLPGPRFRSAGREYVSFSSNNYLGLSGSPRLKAAAAAGIDRYGVGNCESRLLTGDLDLYGALEARLAAIKHRDEAILFATGYLANVGVLSTLVRWPLMARMYGFTSRRMSRYAYFADEFSHVSIKEGIRLSGAISVTYRHADLDDLESKLAATSADIRIIVTDGVFSQDGDIALLPELVGLADRWGATIYIDDAHGTGVLGATGAGTTEHFGVDSPRLIQMGTLSKAYGAIGGFIATDRILADVLRLSTQAYGFTSTIPPDQAAALIEATRMVVDEPARRERLWSNQKYCVQRLLEKGITPLSTQTPILPLLVGAEDHGERVGAALRAQGMHVDLIKFPAVGLGRSRLRLIINEGHTTQEIDHLTEVLARELPDIG